MATVAAILGFRSERFSYFWYTNCPDTSHQVSSQLVLPVTKRSLKWFSRWLPWRPSWIFNQNDFSYFESPSHPDTSHRFESIGSLVLEKKAENIFSRWPPGCPIGTILAIFDLQVIPSFPTKFRVSWPFRSGEEAQNRFSRRRPSWISDRNDFRCFWCTSCPDTFYQVSRHLAFRFRIRSAQ